MLSPAKVRRNERAFRVIDRINAHSFDKDTWLLVAVGLLIIVGIVASRRIQFDSDLRHIGYKSERLIESERLYDEKNFDGFDQLYFASTSKDLEEALAANEIMLDALDSLRAEGMLNNFSGVVPKLFVPLDKQRVRIEAWKAYWTPERIATVRTRLSEAARKRGLSPILFTPFFAMLRMASRCPISKHSYSGLI